MTITLDNRDTENVHIDTYGMLTSDSADEMQLENFREDGQSDSYDDYEWDYDHDAIVKDFAMASINYLTHELTTDDAKIVTAITYKSHGSPRYYNYTTDHYVAEYEYNFIALNKYVTANYDAIREKALGYDRSIIDGDVSTENLAHAGLCHYIDSVIDRDSYNYHMWECETEIYYENATVEPVKKD